MGTATYLIAIGSNMRTRWGSPQALVTSLLRVSASPRESLQWFTRRRGDAESVLAVSRIHTTAALGPGKRSYANAIAIIKSDLAPPQLLDHLKQIERAHGRRPGRRWGDRPLDLDIIAWSGGIWALPGLTIPHISFRKRLFVLAPLVEIAPDWRDPVTHLTARQLLARTSKKKTLPS